MVESPRLLILGAHPDDAEFHCGGLAALYRQQGAAVKMVSVTDGAAGHHELEADQLAEVRRREAAEAAAVIGAESQVWDFPDSALECTLTLRRRIIIEIRRYRPDLVLTHRPNDYHPDHRAVGQAVQDASFLVRVPKAAPEAPALARDPVVAYMTDLFTRPYPLAPDVVLDVSDRLDTVVEMLARHRSQVFQWLPYLEGSLAEVPEGDAEQKEWLRRWYVERTQGRCERFREALQEAYGVQRAAGVRLVEVYEISQYARPLDQQLRAALFPSAPAL